MLWYASLCGNRPWDCILCSEAYEKALWLASLLRSGCGCVGTVLCCEADEKALWLASLCGVGVLKSMFLVHGEDLAGISLVKSTNLSLYEDLTA